MPLRRTQANREQWSSAHRAAVEDVLKLQSAQLCPVAKGTSATVAPDLEESLALTLSDAFSSLAVSSRAAALDACLPTLIRYCDSSAALHTHSASPPC